MEEQPNRYNPKFRRRKKHQGSAWTPANQPALKPDGAWCRWCKTRHGYMTMGIAYERRERKIPQYLCGEHYIVRVPYWVILWSCRKTGFIIEEMELTRKSQEG